MKAQRAMNDLCRMDLDRKIAVIAPELMATAFAVLIDSAPHQYLLASASSLNELRTVLGEKKPDVILAYLVQESESHNGKTAFEMISQIKVTWPAILHVAIVKYASQLDKAKKSGEDLVLVDGANVKRLLAAINGELK